jgi:hypothetical protein
MRSLALGHAVGFARDDKILEVTYVENASIYGCFRPKMAEDVRKY